MNAVFSKLSHSLQKRSGELLRHVDCRYSGGRFKAEFDDFIAKAIGCSTKGFVLFVDHNLGGGANLYRSNWLRKACDSGTAVLLLTYDYPGRQYRLELIADEIRKSLGLYSFDCVKLLIASCGIIQEIVLSELVSYPDPLHFMDFLADLKVRMDSRMRVLVHDYYCVCPGVHLFDWTGRYCGPSLDEARCAKCLKHLDLHIKKNMGAVYNIALWRSSWKRLLSASDAVVCFSESSRMILHAIYPDLDSARYLVQPHDCTHLDSAMAASHGEMILIGVLGHINEMKGAGILQEMVRYVEEKKLPVYFIVIGSVSPHIDCHRVVETGSYPHHELYRLIELFAPDAFLIPSICPETFSYTTEELIHTRKPLAVFNLGAPAERVSRYEKGLVLSSIDPVVAVNELIRFVREDLKRTMF